MDREFDNPDEQRRNAFRNRTFNLSYRGELRESEEILRGRMVRTSYDANKSMPAEISVEQKYAESLGIDLGDQITIEVSGVQVIAEVVNIRRVLWTSFQPNFSFKCNRVCWSRLRKLLSLRSTTYPSKKSRLFKICLSENSQPFPSSMSNGQEGKSFRLWDR